MPKRRARSPIRLVDVVFLAGTASGTVFSLSNFQMLSGGSVPLNCILAYNTPIRGCRIRDFTEKTCSEECRDSLNEVQNNVQASCDLISASEGTLLSKAQKGTLTDSLCRPEDVSTSIAPTPTPETTIRSFSIIPSETPPPPESTSESSTISSVPSTSEPESTPLSTSTSKIKSTVKPKSTSMPPLSSTTSESALAKSTSTTTTQRPKQTIPPGSGGGSPFDFVGASSKLRPLDAVLLLSAAGCAAALLVA